MAYAYPLCGKHLLYRNRLLTIWSEFNEIATLKGLLSSNLLDIFCHTFGPHWHIIMDGWCVDRLSSPCESICRNWFKYLKLNKYFSSVFIVAVFYISAFVKTYRRNQPPLHECPKACRLQLFFTAKITDNIFINNAAIAISLTGCWTDQWLKFAKRVNRAGDYSFSVRAAADLLNHYYNFVLFDGLGEVCANY